MNRTRNWELNKTANIESYIIHTESLLIFLCFHIFRSLGLHCSICPGPELGVVLHRVAECCTLPCHIVSSIVSRVRLLTRTQPGNTNTSTRRSRSESFLTMIPCAKVDDGKCTRCKREYRCRSADLSNFLHSGFFLDQSKARPTSGPNSKHVHDVHGSDISKHIGIKRYKLLQLQIVAP